MNCKIKRLSAVILALLMMSMTALTSFAQTDYQLMETELAVEALTEDTAEDNIIVTETGPVDETDAGEAVIV
ncbi:MAG: hypothetical protein Q4E54_08175 [Lachnospiraceae bacterium]|nr:hypothetical protein [Lachnospiraceae bacterium]